MSTPSIFSDVAGTAENKFVAKFEPQGILAQRSTTLIPAGTAASTIVGLVRFEKGFSLTSLAFETDDLDTGLTVVIDIGYVYDGTTGEDPNALFSGLTIAQSGDDVVWPQSGGSLTGSSFTATDGGYLSVTITAGPTDTEGSFRAIAEFTYDI
jgi:hypothetical protein